MFEGDVVIHFARRAGRLASLRFCDGYAEVSTAAQRARRRRDRSVLLALTLRGPR